MSQSLLGTRSFPLSFIFISVTRRRSLPFCLTTRSLLPSLSLSRSTRIGLRRTSIARGSELSSEIAIRMDFFSVVTFFPLIFLSFLSTPACHPAAGNISRFYLSLSLSPFHISTPLICSKKSPVEIARFRGFNDGRIKDTWLPTRFYTIPKISSVSISIPLNPHPWPRPPTHPPRLERIPRSFHGISRGFVRGTH